MPVSGCYCPDAMKNGPLWQLYDISADNPEFCLFESVIDEFVDIGGFPVEYYISAPNMDRLYGEDANNALWGPFVVKFIYEPTEEPSIIESFGVTSDETLQFAMVPKLTFSKELSAAYIANPALSAQPWQPKPGDVIKTLWNDRNYEVVDMGAENQIFMARKLIWELILRPFRFSEQTDEQYEIHTGLDASLRPPLPSASDGKPIDGYNDDHYGDNTWIEAESDKIDDYDDVDTKIFGY